MLAPISPSAAQTRNTAALDSTRANSQAARNQPESTDSVTDASAAPEEQSSSTAGQSGPEAVQPGNTPATLTVSQAQGIIADSLDQIAAGEIAPLEPEASSATNETDAAAAADTIGRLLARNGAFADLAAPLSIIAAARAELIESGISDENLASFDKALETLVIQRFLSASGNPNADPVLLSESRDTLQRSSVIPTSDGDAVSLANAVIMGANAAVSNVEPDQTVDLSGANAQELGSAAADAADRLGRLAGEFRLGDTYSETQTELATIRAQVQANGATPAELSAFDTAVATISRERALEIIRSPLFDVDALRAARAILKSGELEAMSDPTSDLEEEIASTVSKLVRSAIDAPIDTALATEIAALSSERLISRLEEVASSITNEASDLLSLSRDEGTDPQPTDASREYAAIRAQLKADGATEQQLAELDDTLTQVVTQQTSSRLDIPLTDDEQRLEARLPLAALTSTEEVRLARLNDDSELNESETSDSVLTASERESIGEAVSLALQYEAPNELPFGNFSIATLEELEAALSVAADVIAEALMTNEARFQGALELFAQARDEIIRRLPVTALPNNLLNAFEQRIIARASVLKTPGPEDDAQLPSRSAAILGALYDIGVDGPFGVAAQNSFEGDNGAEPVNIFVIEPTPAQTRFSAHDVVVTNVIEPQLQEAGQSYELTTIHASPKENAIFDALLSVADMAAQLEGPVYVNLSIAKELQPTDIESALNALRDTDLVPDELLNTPINQENFDLFADTVRSIALASLDPERTDVAEALGTQLGRLQSIGLTTQAMEAAAAAGIDVFVGTTNSSTAFSTFQFVNDDGLAGSITRVANTSNGSDDVFDTNDFILPEQGEDFPEDETAPSGIALGLNTNGFYRGTGVDAYAVGDSQARLSESRVRGASFATPEMLVNAVLGRFDPDTETRINSEMVA